MSPARATRADRARPSSATSRLAVSLTAIRVRTPLKNRLWVIRPIGKKTVPQLVAGPATIRVRATRPVFFGLRTAETVVTRDVTVRLEPPRVSVVSLHHFVNLGGAEFVVLRATPSDVEAGVRVGDASYPAYPGSAAGLTDPGLRVAFDALTSRAAGHAAGVEVEPRARIWPSRSP